MAEDGDKSMEDRTENATPYRREQMRKQGKVAMSRELLSVVMLLMVGGGLYFSGAHFVTQFQLLCEQFFRFDQWKVIDKIGLFELSVAAVKSWGWMVLPVFSIAFFAGIIACAAQIGFYVTWEPLTPNMGRINPLNGFKRIFSAKGIFEAPKVVLKMGIAGIILWFFIKGLVPQVGSMMQMDPAEVISFQLTIVAKLFFMLVMALAVMAAMDYAWQKFQHEREMKMTRKEVKDEMKLREGDPLIKARVRTIQRRIASQRMMEAVPKADVVITNPTHLAVALKYDQDEMAAPKVVAKGAGHIAKKIRELARTNQVPVVENKPLARTLFKQIEIGRYIPRELYKAVAEVLAYVYRLKRAAEQAYA